MKLRRLAATAVAWLAVSYVVGDISLRGQDCGEDCVPESECSIPPCPGGYVDNGAGCCCSTHSPIVIDVDGQGFLLTNLVDGVNFDINDRFYLNRVSWIQQTSTNAWLALDRDGDGTIDDASELFGNLTPQPPPPPGMARNGFLALAVFDQPLYGGNGDGIIDARDAVFSRLRLWQDLNHDGISQPEELKTLPEMGVAAISLQYTESRRTDQYGNVFRYLGEFYRTDGSTSRGIVDVLLLVGRRISTAAEPTAAQP